MTITRIQVRRGTAAAWTAANPVLAEGEPGLELGTGKIKYGDGLSTWSDLSYASSGSGGSSGGGGSSDQLSVATFGALGDGSTNDTAAIQAAINASRTAGGGAVFFPPGIYRITSQLTLYDYVRLVGESMKTTTIKQTSTAAAGVFGHQLEGAGIEELTVLGPGSGSGQGVHFDRATTPSLGINYRINMRRVMIDSFGGDGLHVEQCIVSSFDTVEARGCGGHGFNFHGIDPGDGASGTSVNFTACYANANAQAGYRIRTMTYCTLDACATDSCGVGYWVENSGGIVLNGCGAEAVLNKSSTYPGDGVRLNVCSGVVLNGGFLYDVTRHGVLVTGSQGVVLNGVRQFNDTGGGTNSVNFQSSTGTIIGLTHSLPLSISGDSTVPMIDVDGATHFPGTQGFVDVAMPNFYDPALAARVAGDDHARLYIEAGGAINFGAGGTADTDARLLRAWANTLQTDGLFIPAKLGIGNFGAAAGPVGAVVGMFLVTNVSGTDVGYVPVYESIGSVA